MSMTAPIRSQDPWPADKRLHHASDSYLKQGKDPFALWEKRIEHAARLKFGAMRQIVWWHDFFPDQDSIRRGGNWELLDFFMDCAVSHGLKLLFSVEHRPKATQTWFCHDEDRSRTRSGNWDKNWDGTTRLSYASPRFGYALEYFRRFTEHCLPWQNAGHIIALCPTITAEAEIPYSCAEMEDYNPFFLAEFRTWLKTRYSSLSALNAAWGTSHNGFDDIHDVGLLSQPSGHDWVLFRDLKARQFIDSCSDVLARLPGISNPYRLILDYGNLGDTMCWQRGSLGMTLHAQNEAVWGIKHNDEHWYDPIYTSSLLMGNAKRLGKFAFNEMFYRNDPTIYDGDIVTGLMQEIRKHYDQGVNGVSFGHIMPEIEHTAEAVKRLQDAGDWDAPVTPRDPTAPTVHVNLTDLLALHDWKIKENYVDPLVEKGAKQVNLLIDRDLDAPLLPVIPPLPWPMP